MLPYHMKLYGPCFLAHHGLQKVAKNCPKEQKIDFSYNYSRETLVKLTWTVLDLGMDLRDSVAR